MPTPVALTIAGSDSSGGAGVQADLGTFAVFEVSGVCAVTAVTAQNAKRVTAIHHVPPAMIEAQIDAVVDDARVDGAKTGMLGTAAAVEIVATTLARHRLRPVVDPVLASTSGATLLSPDALTTLVRRLLPGAAVVTPNRSEAERLSGQIIRTVDDAREAARRIRDLGPDAVVVTGGHLALAGNTVIDIVHDGQNLFEVSAPRRRRAGRGRAHGTGCRFSAALVAGLVRGAGVVDAAQTAQRYVGAALEDASGPGAAGRRRESPA